MSATIKSTLECMAANTSGDISVLRRLFGFQRSRVPKDPDTSKTAEVSVLAQLRAPHGKHINLNIIRVGIEGYTSAEFDKILENIDHAIYKARNVYATVDLGLGRVEHYFVTAAEADGKDDIGSKQESEELSADWTVPNDGIDAFIVDNISADFGGRSPINGPCDKDGLDTGPLAGHAGHSRDKAARALPHEIGHYLGLSHDSGNLDPANLMTPADTPGVVLRTSVLLNSSQGETVRSHCFVKNGC